MASLIQRPNGTYYIQYCVSGRARRVSTGTDSLQLAKEKLRQFESAQLRGIDNPLPTRTPIPQVVAAYVQKIRTFKTAKSAQTDVYYLRDAFGPICDEVRVNSRKLSPLAKIAIVSAGFVVLRPAPAFWKVLAMAASLAYWVGFTWLLIGFM